MTFTFDGPFFRTDEAAAYLSYRGEHARRSLRRFLVAQGVPTFRRGHAVLIKKVDLDKAIGAHGKPVAVAPPRQLQAVGSR